MFTVIRSKSGSNALEGLDFSWRNRVNASPGTTDLLHPDPFYRQNIKRQGTTFILSKARFINKIWLGKTLLNRLNI